MNPNTNAWNRLRYGLYAPGYDLVGRLMDPARRRSIGLLDLRPGERVLLTGAGTGLDLPFVPPGVTINAIDLSERMLDRCAARARELDRDVSCRVMDAARLDLPDESFDAVVLHLVLAVVPDPVATACEAARVLVPGGRAVIFDKFLPAGRKPSLPRRIACAVSNLLFSDINRQLEPLLEEAGLVIEHDEPSYGGGAYRIVLVRKP